MVKFNANKQELELIAKIARRAYHFAIEIDLDYEKRDIVMDLDACHSNGCPLRLEELLHADNFNFAHDVFGIRRHIDRETGELKDCFLPRYAAFVAA